MDDILNGLNLDVPAVIAMVSVQVLVVTQGLKKLLDQFSWVLKLIGQETIGGMASMVLALIVTVMTVVVQVIADEQLSGTDIRLVWDTVMAAIASFGLHDLVRGKREPARE